MRAHWLFQREGTQELCPIAFLAPELVAKGRELFPPRLLVAD